MKKRRAQQRAVELTRKPKSFTSEPYTVELCAGNRRASPGSSWASPGNHIELRHRTINIQHGVVVLHYCTVRSCGVSPGNHIDVHQGALELHQGALELHQGALELHQGALELHQVAIELLSCWILALVMYGLYPNWTSPLVTLTSMEKKTNSQRLRFSHLTQSFTGEDDVCTVQTAWSGHPSPATEYQLLNTNTVLQHRYAEERKKIGYVQRCEL